MDSGEGAMASPDDLRLLVRAIALAREARQSGNHPFGALLADPDGVVLAEAMNTVETDRDPTGHAELNLIRESARLGPDILTHATLYSSTEPCAMCAGGIYWAGIGRVVYALAESELLAFTGSDRRNPTLALPSRNVFAAGNRPIDVCGPVELPEARDVQRGFWKGR